MDTEAQRLTSTGLAIKLTFPLGRYHATSAGTTANEAQTEWPPSPWRLSRALVSVWKLRAPEFGDSEVLPILDQLATSCVYELPDAARGHTRHYLRADDGSKDKTFLTIDAFASMVRGGGVIAFWPEATLDSSQRRILSSICSQLTYLGRAESLCDAQVLEPEQHSQVNINAAPFDGPAADAVADVGAASIRLLTPERPVTLDQLAVSWSQLRGKQRMVTPPRTSYVDYAVPAPARPSGVQRTPRPTAQPTAVRFALVAKEPGRSAPRPRLSDAIVYTHALRAAAQSRFGRAHDGAGTVTLSGHLAGAGRTDHAHAHYLALSAGQRLAGSRKLVDLLAWAPGGLTEDELRALTSIHELRGFEYMPGFDATALLMTAYGAVDDVAPELIGPSTRFVSETAATPGRHPKGARTWGEQLHYELTAALEERNFPPAAIEIGGRSPHVRTRRPGKTRGHSQAFQVSLEFKEQVRGPITLGAHSHFGLGLFRPI